LAKILAEQPQLVFVAGPPTYLTGFRIEEDNIEKGLPNSKWLVENIPSTILGHHTLKDEKWKSFFQPILDAAKAVGNNVLTAAEFK
jgi:predicted metallo-beta-lactamase superfamily hydrolase